MRRTEYGYVSDTEYLVDLDLDHWLKERNRLQAIVYTNPECGKCRMTINMLRKAMPVRSKQAETHDLEAFKAAGIRVMPVVYVFKNNKPIDQWSDMRVDKIKHYMGTHNA